MLLKAMSHLHCFFYRECEKKSRHQARLEFRRKQLINDLFCSGPSKSSFHAFKSSGDNGVLVNSNILNRFFSCTDNLEDLFRNTSDSIIDHKSLLCQHGSGKIASIKYTAELFSLTPCII